MLDKPADKKKVLLGMSGGLDSTMSALLLKKAGYSVIGVTLKMFHTDPEKQLVSITKAQNLARKLNIEHYVEDIELTFKRNVVDYFCNEYLLGRTPNPCNRCNPVVKWPSLLKKANELGCYFVATGHYVQKVYMEGNWYIKKGIDKTKDQSYFLWNLDQNILARALFPLGQYTKEEIRRLALQNDLKTTAQQRESMGICFLEPTNYRDFLKERHKNGELEIKSGEIVNEKGEILGHHAGIAFYTIGQKKGLELNDKNYFVTRLEPSTNQVVVSKTDHMETSSLELSQFYFTHPLDNEKFLPVKIRIRGIDKIPEIQGTVKKTGQLLHVYFNQKAWAITPGQSIVFYKNECVIGGAIV